MLLDDAQYAVGWWLHLWCSQSGGEHSRNMDDISCIVGMIDRCAIVAAAGSLLSASRSRDTCDSTSFLYDDEPTQIGASGHYLPGLPMTSLVNDKTTRDLSLRFILCDIRCKRDNEQGMKITTLFTCMRINRRIITIYNFCYIRKWFNYMSKNWFFRCLPGDAFGIFVLYAIKNLLKNRDRALLW